jgi:hypothetical protein
LHVFYSRLHAFLGFAWYNTDIILCMI